MNTTIYSILSENYEERKVTIDIYEWLLFIMVVKEAISMRPNDPVEEWKYDLRWRHY